jgi:two-component system, response regulator PdtaR
MTEMKKKALIVEDEFLIAEGLRAQLDSLDVDVCGVASTAEDALALAMKHRPDFVLMDVRLDSERDGVDAALDIHAHVDSQVIFVTGSREQTTIDRIAADHPAATLFKPISHLQLKRTIEALR